MKKLFIILLLGFNSFIYAQNAQEFLVLKGDYLGQTPPGDTPVVFVPGIVSVNGRYEYGLSVSPDGNEIYFTADSPGDGLMVIKREFGKWTEPQTANLRGNHSWEFEAFFANEGKNLLAYQIKPNTSDEEIIKKMEAAKLVDANNPEIYNQLGITYSNKNNNNKALENYLKVLNLRPDNINDYNNVGTTFMHLNDGPKAIQYLVKGLELCKNRPHEYDCTTLIQNIASTYYAHKVSKNEAEDRSMVIKYSEEGLKSITPLKDPFNFTRFNFLIAEVHNNDDNIENISELEIALRYYNEVLKFKESPWYETSGQRVAIIENNLKVLKKKKK